MSSTLSQIAAITAGLALYTTGLIFFFTEINTKGLLKSLTFSVSLAVVAARCPRAWRSRSKCTGNRTLDRQP